MHMYDSDSDMAVTDHTVTVLVTILTDLTNLLLPTVCTILTDSTTQEHTKN